MTAEEERLKNHITYMNREINRIHKSIDSINSKLDRHDEKYITRREVTVFSGVVSFLVGLAVNLFMKNAK